MLRFLKNTALNGDEIPALFALRQKGRAALKNLPDKKTEAYKYTPIAKALKDEMFIKPDHHCAGEDGHCHCHENNLGFEAYEICFCDGVLHEHFHLTDGIEAQSVLDAISEHSAGSLINRVEPEKFPFAALNTACLEQGVFLRICKDVKKPIVLHYKNKENGFCNIRNVIVLEKDASAEIVEIFEGENEISMTNVVNEIFVAKNACFKHYKLQNSSQEAVHVALNYVDVKFGGKYESFTLHKGAKLARNETHVLLKEKGASAKVNAAYNIGKDTLVDTTTDTLHLSPDTTSNQIVRGVIDERARGVFQGKIHIAPMAVGVEGHQVHKALLLSDEAAVDVKPELEIFADDVKCSHGATSGDLDPNEIFYLCSRGIDEKNARRILTSAFLKTAFEDIQNPDIKALFEDFMKK